VKTTLVAQVASHGEQRKEDRARDPIKLLLKEALAQQRNEMMDNYAQILYS
jgi:hypothetical protein